MHSEAVCPNCGQPIILQQSGWWVHDGLPDGCWRLSLDGPGAEEEPETSCVNPQPLDVAMPQWDGRPVVRR